MMDDDQLRRLLHTRSFDRRSLLRMAGGLFVVSAVPPVLASCGGDDDSTAGGDELVGGQVDTSAFAKEPPWRVGRAGAGDVNDWMTFLSAHYEYAINETHGDVFEEYIVTAANFDPTKQVADVEDLLAQDIDLLFIEPASTAALVGPVRAAGDAGVPVVLVSTRVDSQDFTSLVSRNNYYNGQLDAQWMAEKLGGQGQVVALMGFAGSSYANDIWRGVQDVLVGFPDIEVLEMVNANWSVPDAKAATETFLTRYDQIDGVISDGGQMGFGVLNAFQEAGRPLPPITADDWNGWLRAAKAQPEVEFFAVSGSANLSTIAVDIAVNVLNGEPVAQLNDAPFIMFEQDAIDEWYREDLVDGYWGYNSLPDDFIEERFSQ